MKNILSAIPILLATFAWLLLAGFVPGASKVTEIRQPLAEENRFSLDVETYTPANLPYAGLLGFNQRLEESEEAAAYAKFIAGLSFVSFQTEEESEGTAFFDFQSPVALFTPARPELEVELEQLLDISFFEEQAAYTNQMLASAAGVKKNRKVAVSGSAKHYTSVVYRYASRYSLDPHLIFALIHTESNFIPDRISPRNAYGLMQVVPETAGIEVSQWLKLSERPTPEELLRPETNILYGVTYLHLLKKYHLSGIEDERSLEYCLIASYNAGSGAVLRHFGQSKSEAVAVINSLPPEAVLDRLTQDFRATETRKFVGKVLSSKAGYRALYANNTVANSGKKS